MQHDPNNPNPHGTPHETPHETVTRVTQVTRLFEHEDPWAVHRPEGSGPGPYRLAPKVAEAARQLIPRCHPHLQEARIAYLFRTGSWSSRGRPVTGRASTAPALWRFLCGYDLVLVLHEETWQNLTRRGRRALLDHQLSCFAEPVPDKDGQPTWGTREQDIQEFSQVVKRHGICIHSPWGLKELTGQQNLQALQDNLEAEESLGGEHDDEEEHEAPAPPDGGPR